jgi:hypothetical protein
LQCDRRDQTASSLIGRWGARMSAAAAAFVISRAPRFRHAVRIASRSPGHGAAAAPIVRPTAVVACRSVDTVSAADGRGRRANELVVMDACGVGNDRHPDRAWIARRIGYARQRAQHGRTSTDGRTGTAGQAQQDRRSRTSTAEVEGPAPPAPPRATRALPKPAVMGSARLVSMARA